MSLYYDKNNILTNSPGKREIIDDMEGFDINSVNIPKSIYYIKDLNKNSLIWNGTYIGELFEKNIMYKFFNNIYEYWIINYKGWITTCMIKISKYYTQCLVDELKPLFGLNKLGTHYAKYKNKYVILVRARISSDGIYIVSDYTLNNDNKTILKEMSTNSIINNIREIYVFRDLLALNKSTDSCIALRRSDTSHQLYAVSLHDSHINIGKLSNINISTYLPDTVFNKWFKDKSPTSILKKMCNLFNTNNVTNIVFKIKKEIENIVKRVCGKEFANFPDILISRISQKLQYNQK